MIFKKLLKNKKLSINKKEEVISVDELIATAKKHSINLGKGDPYNRLRYYTKIGWLTHMVRKKDKTGTIKGHYPASTVDRLLTIQKLKKQGMTNDEITAQLATSDSIKNIYKSIPITKLKGKMATYLTVLMIFVILLSELGIIQVGKSKTQLIYTNTNNQSTAQSQIIESGTHLIRKDETKVKVPAQSITQNSKVYITFKDNYAPATKFWVAEQTPEVGFTLELDTPVQEDARFDWWIGF